jgi:hypothetical protein
MNKGRSWKWAPIGVGKDAGERVNEEYWREDGWRLKSNETNTL